MNVYLSWRNAPHVWLLEQDGRWFGCRNLRGAWYERQEFKPAELGRCYPQSEAVSRVILWTLGVPGPDELWPIDRLAAELEIGNLAVEAGRIEPLPAGIAHVAPSIPATVLAQYRDETDERRPHWARLGVRVDGGEQ